MDEPVLYTDTGAIRATVGVTTKELPDKLLIDQRLELQIRTDMYSWLPNYQALYDAGNLDGATAAEQYISDLLTQYCMYFGAVRGAEMVLAYRQKVSDGKQAVARFSIDFAALLEALKARLAEVRALLEDAVGVGTSTIAWFGKAVPDYDPVTNT